MGNIIRRYKSEIHGNYRLAYLRWGALSGLVLSLYLLVRHWSGAPCATPADLGKDGLLVVGIVVSMYFYRRSLPDGKVTMKELLLMGLGTGLVAAVLYGLFVWLYCGVLYPEMTELYAQRFKTDDSQTEGYLAALNPGMWALMFGFVNTFLTSIIVTFFGALFFRTEKADVRVRTGRDK
ncbi:MAG: DUF4199 domain-containing protein [Bacteroidales bacterium]|nr:DUF4199 domain-containing protein [Bacteroidales bacterium]